MTLLWQTGVVSLEQFSGSKNIQNLWTSWAATFLRAHTKESMEMEDLFFSYAHIHEKFKDGKAENLLQFLSHLLGTSKVLLSTVTNKEKTAHQATSKQTTNQRLFYLSFILSFFIGFKCSPCSWIWLIWILFSFTDIARWHIQQL